MSAFSLKKPIFLFLFLAATVFFSACAKDKSPAEPTSSYFLKCQVDGVDFQVSDVVTSLFVDQTTDDDFFVISSIDTADASISIFLQGPPRTGTFQTNGSSTGDPECLFWYSTDTKTWITDEDGTNSTITITENNGSLIAGTFSFVAINAEGTTKTITNGSFKAKKL